MTNERSLKTGEIPSYETMLANNLYAYEQALLDPINYAIGANWYPVEHDNCVLVKSDLLGSHGLRLSLKQVTDTVAIISPGRPWSKNIADASHTIAAWTLADDMRQDYLLKNKAGSRFGWAQYKRVWSMLDGNYQFLYTKAPKTFSFSGCLESPLSCELCVVDQHNCHILLGEFLSPLESIGISYAQYIKLLPPMYDAAKHVGLDHRVFQAIIWQWRMAATSKKKFVI
jgi:hypothetical protein